MQTLAVLRAFILAIVLMSISLAANATVAVSPIFSNSMVLQRGKPIPVIGTAAANKTITVTFNSQVKTGTSDAQGKWLVTLDAMVAKTTGGTMTIAESGANTITITDILIGDVWICSGQSNMDMVLASCNRQTEDVNTANFPGIRQFFAPYVGSGDPTRAITGSWTVCTPSTAGNFTAAGFYFARKIYLDQGSTVPIGLFRSSWGGTQIDPWLAPEGASDIPVLAPLYNMEVSPWGPFYLFNGMIYPFSPLPAKGAIWYQGEAGEATNQSPDSYYLKEKAIQQGWKRLLGLDDFALYVVQLANCYEPSIGPNPEGLGSWSNIRQMQAMVANLYRGGCASAMDIGEAADIHPKDKLDVGERLALWALKNDYGRTTVVPSGPILRDVTVSGTKLICSFDYVGSGLMVGSKTPYLPTAEVVGGTLQRFVIAGATGSWYTANASIVGNTVEVSSPSVAAPRKVAYAYWVNPTGANLYNREGLPASPFLVEDATSAGHYTVTATAGAGGSISPIGAISYLKRATALYTITPSDGYYIQDVKVDGVSVGSVKYYTFDPLYANHTIAATFAATAPTYTITTTSTATGAIIPTGPISVAQGGSQSFKMVPNTGCRLISITADGAPLGNRDRVTFADVRSAHALNATFAAIPTPGTGTGLRGDYYIGLNFDIFKISRTDANVNFDWSAGSPNAAIPVDGYTVRWTGQIQPQFSESYKFYLSHDDGAKLWVNNTLIVNNWAGSATSENGTITLVAGQKYAIKLEYQENLNNASCKLEWMSTSLPKEVVPQSQLFPATTPIYTLTASAGANGSFSPSGAVLANAGGSQTFTAVPATGYYVSDLKVDNVSQGAIASYTFTNVTANHTISAAFSALPSYAVSGKVTKLGTSTAISGAKVNFYTSPNAIGTAAFVATTNATGDYTINIPMGNWSMNTSATGYFVSSTQALTVNNAPAGSVNFALADNTRSIPQTSNLIMSAFTDTLPASGNTGNWATYMPAGQTLTAMANPSVETIMGRKWEKNVVTDYDGYLFGTTYTSAIACTGASVVVAAKPVRSGESAGWRSIVDVFYDRLVLGIQNDTGKVCVRRNGSLDNSTTSIPDGQVTILSLVVGTDGSYNVYANGNTTAILTGAATGANSYTSLNPLWNNGGTTGFWSYINIGRNNPDGWTTYNGYIGDVFLYKTALSLAERRQIETDLMSKFITGGATTNTINASAGAGGSVSPAGSTFVTQAGSQTYTIAPNAGYAISDVTVDGVSQGVKTSHTFTNVTAPHSISASFTRISKAITASAGSGGAITPSGVISIFYGDNQAFGITANPGYAVADLKIDGASVAPVTSYTFSNVTTNRTISATFAKLLAMNNRAALTDTKAVGKVVKLWGKIKTINSPLSFTIDDGSGPITVMTNGATLPTGFATNKMVVITSKITKESGNIIVSAQSIAIQ